MTKDFKNKFDLSIPRRKYFSKECGLSSCPECGSMLIEKSCPVLIAAKSDIDEGEILSNLTGSHFCKTCPVVVFESDKIEQAVRVGIKGNRKLRYLVEGIVDLNAIPEEKRHLEIGIEGNPVPLVDFLPDLNKNNRRK